MVYSGNYRFSINLLIMFFLFGGKMKSFASGIILIICFVLYSGCSKNDQQQSDKTQPQPGQTSKDGSSQVSTNFMTLYGIHYNDYFLAEFLSKGGSAVLDNRKKDFEITELISAAKVPSHVTVMAKGFDPWVVQDFINKGARVIINCCDMNNFTIRSLITSIPEIDKRSNITVFAGGKNCCEMIEYARLGAKVKVNRQIEPFMILAFIDASNQLNKLNVEIDCQGFNSNWVSTFLKRGGSVYINHSFPFFDALQFAKTASKEKKGFVQINADRYFITDIENFLNAGAKVILGKDEKIQLTKKFYRSLNSEEIGNLIRLNPDAVTVVADGYRPGEISKFIQLGAKVVFTRSHNDDIVDALYNKTAPPLLPAITKGK